MIKSIQDGAFLRNNDPRVPEGSPFKIVQIVYDGGTHAWYNAKTRVAKVAIDRIFDDNKNRNQGYNLVAGPAD